MSYNYPRLIYAFLLSDFAFVDRDEALWRPFTTPQTSSPAPYHISSVIQYLSALPSSPSIVSTSMLPLPPLPTPALPPSSSMSSTSRPRRSPPPDLVVIETNFNPLAKKNAKPLVPPASTTDRDRLEALGHGTVKGKAGDQKRHEKTTRVTLEQQKLAEQAEAVETLEELRKLVRKR